MSDGPIPVFKLGPDNCQEAAVHPLPSPEQYNAQLWLNNTPHEILILQQFKKPINHNIQDPAIQDIKDLFMQYNLDPMKAYILETSKTHRNQTPKNPPPSTSLTFQPCLPPGNAFPNCLQKVALSPNYFPLSS